MLSQLSLRKILSRPINASSDQAQPVRIEEPPKHAAEAASAKPREIVNKLAHRTLKLRKLEWGISSGHASQHFSEEESPPVLMFTHIPKTAGSSLLHLFRTNIDASRYFELYEFDTQRFEVARETLVERVQSIKTVADIVTSHIPVHYRLWEAIDRPVCNATILRDPVDRLVSHYFYIKAIKHVNAVGALIEKENISLRDYVTVRLLHGSENLMVRLLSTTANPDPARPCTRRMLEEAIENLTQFDIIGVSEQFDQFVDQICDMFSMSLPESLQLNVNAERPRKSEIDSETINAIRERNALDIELYEAAQKEMKRRGSIQQ